MNYRLLSKNLGIVSMLLGASILLSLPWAFPALGQTKTFEAGASMALLGTFGMGVAFGGLLLYLGRHAEGQLHRKEAMTVVGLSWFLATAIGAAPYLLSRTYRGEGVPMTVTDALFESASGFSGAGATVVTDLEDPSLVPRSILFWRSETHLLGGLGIMIFFVAILGQGSAGKALMLAEMPGPDKETGQTRIQHAAWVFALIYFGLNAALTILLRLQGMSSFDALCHSFGTIATGGFSTYNDSIAHFNKLGIEMTIAIFMVLACTNFTLLYLLLLWRPRQMFADVEFRVYLGLLLFATFFLAGFGLYYQDFSGKGESLRYSFFQVTSIITNTDFATHNFDQWNEIGRETLFLLMFAGGCAGSTSCSLKIIRHILFLKIIWIEIEQAWRPTVVRKLRIGGAMIDAPELRRNVLVYFALILVIFMTSWLAIDMVEPDAAWSVQGHTRHEKLVDCASGVAATLNGVGPGLGTLGAIENYSHFQPVSKLIFAVLMIAGRLEIYPVLVLFIPRFWQGM